MRDPKRIDSILEKIKFIWETYPDQRFWQLIMNCMDARYNDYFGDAFFLEDDRFEATLDNQIKEIKGRK